MSNRLAALRGLIDRAGSTGLTLDEFARLDTLQETLIDEFAELNGWEFVCHPFGLRALAENRSFDNELSPMWPHHLYFRHPARFGGGRAAAIVTQPTGGPSIAEIYSQLGYGLILRTPPVTTASFYHPGHARFVVVTRPGVSLEFLPCQMEFVA